MAAGDVVTITTYRDGPLLVRGPFRLQDQEGNEIEVGPQDRRAVPCGKSRIRPFCDGTHALIRFRAPSEPERGRAPAPPRAPRRRGSRATTTRPERAGRRPRHQAWAPRLPHPLVRATRAADAAA